MNRFLTARAGRVALALVLSVALAGPVVASWANVSPATGPAVVRESATTPVLAPAAPATMQPMSSSTKVYITKTGKKYHRAGCRYLKKSKIKKTLGWVKSHHYTPCKVCKPPKR